MKVVYLRDSSSSLARARAWRVPVDVLVKNEYNLDEKNPTSQEKDKMLPPEQLVIEVLEKEKQIIRLIEEIKQALNASYE